MESEKANVMCELFNLSVACKRPTTSTQRRCKIRSKHLIDSTQQAYERHILRKKDNKLFSNKRENLLSHALYALFAVHVCSKLDFPKTEDTFLSYGQRDMQSISEISIFCFNHTSSSSKSIKRYSFLLSLMIS